MYGWYDSIWGKVHCFTNKGRVLAWEVGYRWVDVGSYDELAHLIRWY